MADDDSEERSLRKRLKELYGSVIDTVKKEADNPIGRAQIKTARLAGNATTKAAQIAGEASLNAARAGLEASKTTAKYAKQVGQTGINVSKQMGQASLSAARNLNDMTRDSRNAAWNNLKSGAASAPGVLAQGGRGAISTGNKAAEAAVMAASSVARKSGNIIVNAGGMLNSKKIPFIFFLFIAAYQAAEFFLLKYQIEITYRFLIYGLFFLVAGKKIGYKEAFTLSVISFGMPYLWERVPAQEIFAPAHFVMLLLAFSWSFWLGLTSEFSGLSDFIRTGILIALFLAIVFPQFLLLAEKAGLAGYVPKFDPMMGPKIVEQGIKVSLERIQNIPKVIGDAYSGQLKLATGDYYTGKVDENSKKKIGVYIEKLETADPEYFEGQKVIILADIKAETLKDPIKMSPNCWADKEKRDEIDGMVIPPKLSVDTYDIRSFDCKFPRLAAGSRIITASATFSFETMSYLKTYFMDKDKIRSIRNIGSDPLDTYKIEDKKPIAVYTNGPVSIGMGIMSALPVGLKPGDVDPLSLGITIGNNWDGKIESISELRVGLPKGIEIESSSCSHLFKFDGVEDDYNMYSLDIASERALNPRIFTNIKERQSIRCYLNVKDAYMNDLLGSTPISIKFFRSSVKYDYTIEKQISLEIKENEQLPKGAVGECGTKVIARARMGLGRPAQDGAVWSSDSDPGSAEPISNSGFISWIFNRYSNVYKDSSVSMPASFSEQLSAGKLIDGNLQSPSLPKYDSLVNGDLVFFCGDFDESTEALTDCSNGIAHAGIYSGNGRFIHVGKQVKEETLQLYESNYVGSRRICSEKPLQEREIDQEGAKSTVEVFADEYGIPRDVALGVAYVEGTLQHYASQSYPPVGFCDGKVKCGDLQYCSTGSIGMMQINSCAHPQCFSNDGIIIYDGGGDMCKGAHACSGTDARNIRCNVEASMRLLRGCYNEGQNNPREGCFCGGKYTGWDYAIKCYNGCACDTNTEYVANVRERGQALVG